ncbi:MAG TPA: serine/threonine-protein kinase, partial [Labilithrix sp.]
VPTGVALRIVADACAGLHAAHRLTDEKGHLRGVVHRDVSPHNILLATKGDVKLIDFGIAHAKDRLGADTDAGSLKGKLHYMAPEQAKREKLGAHTDVFALGATLYRMLAGRPAYDGANEAATLAMLMAGTAPAPLPDGVPPLVAAIVERALAHDPGDRYATALGMQTAIEAAMVEEGFVPDVGTWVDQNVTSRYRERREQLAARASKSTAPAGSLGFDETKLATSVPDLPIPPPRKPAPSEPEAKPLPKVDKPKPPPAARAIMSFSAAVTPLEEPPAESTDPVDRSFMDLKALAARRTEPVAEVAKPPLAGGPKPDPEKKKDGEAAKPKPVPVKKKEEPPVAAKSASWIRLAIAVVAVVLITSATLLLLPMIVRDRILANAREAGIDLTLGGVGVGTSGITLRGVTMKIPTIAGVTVTADEVFASGFSASSVRLTGVTVTADGALQDIGPRLVAFYQQEHPRFAGTAADPRHVAIVGAHVTWTRPFGEGTRLDASDFGADLDSKGSDELRASIGRFTLATKKTTLGPWSASFDQGAGSSRARLLFDPALPDGPSALYVFGPEVVPKLTIRIPRAPLAQLGVRPGDLALPADPSTEIEAKIEG